METPTLYYPRCRALFSVVLDGYDDDEQFGKDNPLVVWTVPKSATIHGNGYRQADSWEVTFDYKDFPFDPQQVRMGAVEIYIFDAGGVFSDDAIISRQYTIKPGSTRGRDAMSSEYRDAAGDKSAFVGWAEPCIAGLFDDHSAEFSEGGQWVTIKGQDYTDLLIRKQWPPTKNHTARRIPVGDRLDLWAEKILREADPAGTLSVVVKGINANKLKTVGNKEVSGHRSGIPVQQNTTYWDVLTKVCERYGVICFIKGLDLVITRPRSLDDIQSPDVRQVAWGKNLTYLSMTRHFGHERTPRVILKAWNDKDGKLVTVEEPDDGPKRKESVLSKNPSQRTRDVQHIKAVTAKTSAKPKPKTKSVSLTDEVTTMTVFGSYDKATLRQMAKNHRMLVGRGERKMVIRTRDLCDLAGNQILDLTAGDAFDIAWKDFNISTFQSPGMTAERRAAIIEARGYQPNVARAIANNYERLLGNQPPLRLREYSIMFDVETGVEIEMELLDFIVMNIQREASGPMAPPVEKVDRKLEALMSRAHT